MRILRNLWNSLTAIGLLIGTIFFAFSLTPSLLPRDFVLQGALSGVCLTAGYLLGTILVWLWRYLELPPLPEYVARASLWVAAIASALVATVFLWKFVEWQNITRSLMHMEPVESGRLVEVGLIALGVFVVLLLLGRLIGKLDRGVSGKLGNLMPRRVANLVGLLLVGWIIWAVTDGVLFRVALRAADSSLQRLDALIEPDVARPTSAERTGGPGSIVGWEGLGRMGRAFVASGPSGKDITAFTGKEAKDPIRVYVGLNSADTVQDRAKLALEEMKRTGAFDRSVLVVIAPTGTGWVDPEAMDTLEYLQHGDIASVAVQYSYLLSWLSLLIEPQYGSDTARALFNEVYKYWSALPKEHRPRLYLHGLSLGSLSSDASLDIFDIVGDPIQGALWSGPPFSSRTWKSATAGREAGSPAWLPRFRDGSIIRFYSQSGVAPGDYAQWGPIRIAYLQYASDPVVFFDPFASYREPDWMKPPRGPDVSPALRWFPIVTQLQIGLDMAIATSTPMGFGHVYAPEDYIQPWVDVTQPSGWSAEDIERLKTYFRAKRD
ncbi:alpha/beta-hydrolase family protein [Mesorhizobium sp. GR13]|uniref:alpha/beta hydrolase n=1 Tax=Mesorhizobium sp. GR13 TaxID=2562308 RepID=UPI0010BF7C95|nr:alpha/beta-hydrolase family protein [Mesorhizobium sp. GR13]